MPVADTIPEDITKLALHLSARIDAEAAWGSDNYGINHDLAVAIIAEALHAERLEQARRDAEIIEARLKARRENPNDNWEELDAAAIRTGAGLE